MLASNGALADLISSGARILECACGPCIGMGQSPNSKGVSLRTFNRNFEGRSGTKNGEIYIVSPETAAVSALNGKFTDPRTLDDKIEIEKPHKFLINDNMIVEPANIEDAPKVKIMRGPNIKPFPSAVPLGDNLKAKVMLKAGDNITTDHIMPAGAKILPYRSNIPYLSKFCFSVIDEFFPSRCFDNGRNGIIIGGINYGQGSSREHAALVPLYLGIRAVIAKSFARIHCANLVNASILPLEFCNYDDYDKINEMDELQILDIKKVIAPNKCIIVSNITQGYNFKVKPVISERQKEIILAGGLLNYTKNKLAD
jgi:aconitate hydratase